MAANRPWAHNPARKALRATGSWLLLAAVAAASTASARTQVTQPTPLTLGSRQLRTTGIVPAVKVKGVKGREPRSAYLMTYFKDETHSLYFATSPDGYTFTDVNGGLPVLSGRDIADQRGIRDPYITRGPDGAFYMAMTDLHIFAQREGLRQTEWERPREAYSWGNNRNMIFMRSLDLIHWSMSKVTLADSFPSFADAGCAWAPEMLWDPKVGRMMVYFTTRHGNGPNFMVYSYADAAFSSLTSEPKQILYYPNPSRNTLDADITFAGGKYHMYYVVHDKPGNIRLATSDRINSGYVSTPDKVDPEAKSAEAPNLWRRYGTSKYVLMYDVFGVSPNNMGFAETTDLKTFRNLGRFNEEGSPMKATNFQRPKHGSVMAITPAEAERIRSYFSAR